MLLRFKEDIVPNYCHSFSHAKFQDLTKYITTTVFQHVHLYQFILTEDQPADVIRLQKAVEVPKDNLQSLTDGIQEKQLMKTLIFQELQNNYEKRLKELEEMGLEAMEKAKKNLKKVYTAECTGIPHHRKMISAEVVSSLLSSVVATYVEPTILALSQRLQRQETDMKFRLDKMECLSILNEDYSVMPSMRKTTRLQHLRSSEFKSSNKQREFKHSRQTD